METGSIPLDEFPGKFDLQSTVESGQTYCWDRADGDMYGSTGRFGGSAWYHTVIDGELIRASQRDGDLVWEATTDPVPQLVDLLRLDDDLPAMIDATPEDPLLDAAYDAYRGMRLVRDPFFQCLISFICSAQMRVERIFEMQRALAGTYGERLEVGGEQYFSFPTADRLAQTTEAELRELGLGYRAPYVQASAQLVSEGELRRADIPDEYEAARTALTGYVGVGEKVADCVCLFSLGHLQAVPLDTWIRSAIESHYPDCNRPSYAETSAAIRDRFGPYAGYAQTYVFHYLRHRS